MAGLDLNSEMLETLAKHDNIVGVKLTCGGIAKVARIRNKFEPEQFSALAGQSDWLTPAMAVGGTGVVTGIANLFPKVTNPYSFPKFNLSTKETLLTCHPCSAASKFTTFSSPGRQRKLRRLN